MLRRVAVDVPDTRLASRARDDHPVVDALLQWRKAERIATTYGYRWLDEHVHGGRLRGEWSSSDGAAGRMTASSGLHNLPAEMRPAVAAEAGHVFVRADLGQIEPRVLAAVSGDTALIGATADDDLYAPVAERLRVTRDIAKVAVLGAMYGSTTGESAHALRGLEREYPVAMGICPPPPRPGSAATTCSRSVGGGCGCGSTTRWTTPARATSIAPGGLRLPAAGSPATRSCRGRRPRCSRCGRSSCGRGVAAIGAQIVLCLHDELLVQAPEEHAEQARSVVADALAEAAYRWSPAPEVRFVADVSIIRRWSEAKG